MYCTECNHSYYSVIPCDAKVRYHFKTIFTKKLWKATCVTVQTIMCSCANKPFLKIWLLCINFEKFTSINVTSITVEREFGGLWLVARNLYIYEFLKVNAQQPNFQELLCLHSLSSVIFQLNLLSAKFLLSMNSLWNYLCWDSKRWRYIWFLNATVVFEFLVFDHQEWIHSFAPEETVLS